MIRTGQAHCVRGGRNHAGTAASLKCRVLVAFSPPHVLRGPIAHHVRTAPRAQSPADVKTLALLIIHTNPHVRDCGATRAPTGGSSYPPSVVHLRRGHRAPPPGKKLESPDTPASAGTASAKPTIVNCRAGRRGGRCRPAAENPASPPTGRRALPDALSVEGLPSQRGIARPRYQGGVIAPARRRSERDAIRPALWPTGPSPDRGRSLGPWPVHAQQDAGYEGHAVEGMVR